MINRIKILLFSLISCVSISRLHGSTTSHKDSIIRYSLRSDNFLVPLDSTDHYLYNSLYVHRALDSHQMVDSFIFCSSINSSCHVIFRSLRDSNVGVWEICIDSMWRVFFKNSKISRIILSLEQKSIVPCGSRYIGTKQVYGFYYKCLGKMGGESENIYWFHQFHGIVAFENGSRKYARDDLVY